MAGPGHAARLVVREGAGRGTAFDLDGDETLIGRAATGGISLPDDGISREHALILYDAESDSYVLEDLQSTNGTRVNGRRVRSVTLSDGDEVRIGRTAFQFVRQPTDV